MYGRVSGLRCGSPGMSDTGGCPRRRGAKTLLLPGSDDLEKDGLILVDDGIIHGDAVDVFQPADVAGIVALVTGLDLNELAQRLVLLQFALYSSVGTGTGPGNVLETDLDPVAQLTCSGVEVSHTAEVQHQSRAGSPQERDPLLDKVAGACNEVAWLNDLVPGFVVVGMDANIGLVCGHVRDPPGRSDRLMPTMSFLPKEGRP